jgi:hypothetical protein
MTGVSDTISITTSKQVTNASVMFVMNHDWVGDLIVRLTHGSTTRALLNRPGRPGFGENYGCSGDNIDCTLDDRGTFPAHDTCDLVEGHTAITGTLTPNESLDVFNGQNTSGA